MKLIDEYDNFANEVLASRDRGEDRYQALVGGEGVIKTVFKAVKAAAAGRGLDRVFITGVSPVVMADITSGYDFSLREDGGQVYNPTLDRERLAAGVRFYKTGDSAPVCRFVEQRFLPVFDNRDLRWSNELVVKTVFLTVPFDDTGYIMDSETAIGRGSCGLSMIKLRTHAVVCIGLLRLVW